MTTNNRLIESRKTYDYAFFGSENTKILVPEFETEPDDKKINAQPYIFVGDAVQHPVEIGDIPDSHFASIHTRQEHQKMEALFPTRDGYFENPVVPKIISGKSTRINKISYHKK